jgi:uncharacterized membrane protein YraQ (UPF0718 family)
MRLIAKYKRSFLLFLSYHFIMMKPDKNGLILEIARKALALFLSMLPMLLATVALVGLLQTYVSTEILHSLFRGDILVDTLIGTLSGGVSVGPPIISYIIGGELMDEGISVYAISAFILSWVSLGVIQLPLEASILGLRFTIVRNLLALGSAFLIALALGFTLKLFT